MPELQIIARYRITAGMEEEIFALLPRLAHASRGEPGNVSFVVYRGLDDERDVVLLERYASRDAFAAHTEFPYYKDLVLDQIFPRLDHRDVEQYDVGA